MGGAEELAKALEDSLLEPGSSKKPDEKDIKIIAVIAHEYTYDVTSDNEGCDKYMASSDKANLRIYEDLGFEPVNRLDLLHLLEEGIDHRIDDSKIPKRPTLLEIMKPAYLAKYEHP